MEASLDQVHQTQHLRRRLTWVAHLFKAVAYQYHRSLGVKLASLIPADGVVVDVGAHSGQHAKLFARMVPKGAVYAFEPGSYAGSILRPVLHAHRLGNVKVVPLGLSDHPSVEILHVPLKRRGSVGFGLSHLGQDSRGGTTLAEEVRLTTLDLFAAEEGFKRLDFIKVDIEGWEAHFLRGAEATILRFRPALLLEVIVPTLARAGSTPEDIFGFFRPLDYVAFKTFERDDYRMVQVDSFDGSADYLFVPRSRAGLVPQG